MGKFVKHGAREEVPRLQRPIGWVRAILGENDRAPTAPDERALVKLAPEDDPYAEAQGSGERLQPRDDLGTSPDGAMNLDLVGLDGVDRLRLRVVFERSRLKLQIHREPVSVLV